MDKKERTEMLQRIDRAFSEINEALNQSDNYEGTLLAIEHAQLEVLRVIATLPIINTDQT